MNLIWYIFFLRFAGSICCLYQLENNETLEAKTFPNWISSSLSLLSFKNCNINFPACNLITKKNFPKGILVFYGSCKLFFLSPSNLIFLSFIWNVIVFKNFSLNIFPSPITLMYMWECLQLSVNVKLLQEAIRRNEISTIELRKGSLCVGSNWEYFLQFHIFFTSNFFLVCHTTAKQAKENVGWNFYFCERIRLKFMLPWWCCWLFLFVAMCVISFYVRLGHSRVLSSFLVNCGMTH